MREFVEVVGATNVRERGPEIAVWPASTEEVAAVMKICTVHQFTVTPTGGGTKLSWGTSVVPTVVLHTKRLAGLREHSWQDLTATAGAGTTWTTLQQHLARHGQRVALDAYSAAMATVGGVIATNDSGLLRLKYGSLRDLVLGMTIVLADGTIARTGGKVVKNVAGYDLPKLLTGSFGTLGIITEATFRLHPVAQHCATFTLRSTDISSLADLMTAVLKAGMSLEQMQLRTEPLGFALDIQFASLPEVLTQDEQKLRALAERLVVEPADKDILLSRDRMFDERGATVIKIVALPSKLAAIVAGIAEIARLPGHMARCVANPVGIVTATLTTPEDGPGMIIKDLRARLASTGGLVTVLEPGRLREFDAWGPPPPALDIMCAIKQEFDPLRLLNPGKFVGGL